MTRGATKSEVRLSTSNVNGDASLMSQYMAVKPKKAYPRVSGRFIAGQPVSWMTTYSEGFAQILAKDDPLGLVDAVLDEVMDVFERGIKSRLWDLLVRLGP